jgi:hypothetical protein
VIISLSLADLQEWQSAIAKRFADLLNQGFRDPNVEKVHLNFRTIGGFSTDDGDDLTKYKATVDGDVIRIDDPKNTIFIRAGDDLQMVTYTYRSSRSGQYL